LSALLTDLYELTMAAGYAAAGKAGEIATFELFVRRLPRRRNFLIAAGLQQAVDYLLNLRFRPEEISFLRGLPQFERAPEGFWNLLAGFRFTGDVWALPEGTPVFGGEPLLTVRAPIIEAQIVETYLLSTIGFQTMIASKAARVAEAAGGRPVIEFGTRRAHSPEAGVLAARAAYIGGCAGTSNVEAGFRFSVPVQGTSAHSWVQSFPSETDSFRRLQELLGPRTVHLIDTYDALQGARRAAALGPPLWGIRIDSGNLAVLARKARALLDQAGLGDAKIMLSGDLDEYRLQELTATGVPYDSAGVGTELSTSGDAPTLGVVYKLVQLDSGAGTRYTAKFSPEKQTFPGAKQIFRYAAHDEITRHFECPCDRNPIPEAMLRPVILAGQLVAPLPSLGESRRHARDSVARLPAQLRALDPAPTPYLVTRSPALQLLFEEVAHADRIL
jgi:nicotinate phosphoribosyltransferase